MDGRHVAGHWGVLAPLTKDDRVTPFLTRRNLVAGTSALLATRAAASSPDKAAPIAAIEARHGGRLGVFVLDTGSGRVLAHRADERFLLCSTFKGVLAAMVLSRVDAGHDDLSHSVAYGEQDLLPPSPVTSAHVKEGTLSVGALCEAILLVSDNAAANLLLARVGGPPALTTFARGLGDQVTRFDRYELAAGQRSGDLDTTTPRAIVQTARTMILGDALSAASRVRLEEWMVACRVGKTRLRASFPPAWVTADRTGTGDGACNDYAMVRRLRGEPLVMAAYYDAPGMDMAAQEAVLREVGSTIVAWAR